MNDKNHEIVERRLETLIYQQGAAQEKLVYYILAINAACIAFSVNLTKDTILTFEKDSLLGFAVLFWGFSFYSGIVQIQNREVALEANIKSLQYWLKGQKVSNYIENELKIRSMRGVRYRKCQNWFLLLGAVSFMVWHVIK